MPRNFTNTKIYKDIIKNKLRCYFISPHFDDAVFSGGSLLRHLSKKHIPITVVNIFTKASKRPYTLSVKKFLRSCDYTDADILYSDRVKEDDKVITGIGAKVINLNFIDALWRRKKVPQTLNRLTRFIPEIEYTYPIFSVAMKLGFVSKHDKKLVKFISQRLEKIIPKNSVVFCPIAAGKHMDHTITRDVCKNLNVPTVYWLDYPYSRNSNPDRHFLKTNKLTAFKYTINSKVKSDLANGYKSQIDAIFGKKQITIKENEYYYV